MPRETSELPSYLDTIENLFVMFDVPEDLKSKMLLAHLTGKAKYVVSKLSVDQLNGYDFVKQHLLTEFKISPRELRSRFFNAQKKPDESYTVFRGRLELTLCHYLKARSIDTLEKLTDVLVVDKLKDCLSPGTLRYVLGLEGEDCFSSHKVASTADVYSSNYNEDGSYKAGSTFSLPLYEKNVFHSNKKFQGNYSQKFKSYGNAETGVKSNVDTVSGVSTGKFKSQSNDAGNNGNWTSRGNGSKTVNGANKNSTTQPFVKRAQESARFARTFLG